MKVVKLADLYQITGQYSIQLGKTKSTGTIGKAG